MKGRSADLMVDLSVAAIADTHENRKHVGPWWFVPLHGALAQFGLYQPPKSGGEEGRREGSRDAGNADQDETTHWL